MPTGYEGYGALGEMLAGGGGDPGVYDKTLRDAYATDRGLQMARRARAQALIDMDRATARQGITAAALGELGHSPQAAALGEAILRSATTPNINSLGDYQRPGYDVAADIARTSILGDDSVDPEAYNRANAFMEGKAYEPVRSLGGAFVPSGVALGDEEFVAIPTPTTAENIAATQARVAQGQQRTDASVAKAGREKPPSNDDALLEQARGAIAAGADAAAVAARLRQRGYPQLAKKVHEGGE